MLLFNISNHQPFALTKWYYVQCLAAVLVGLSVVYYFGKYFYLTFTAQPLHGTVQQRELLQFKDGGKFVCWIDWSNNLLSAGYKFRV